MSMSACSSAGLSSTSRSSSSWANRALTPLSSRSARSRSSCSVAKTTVVESLNEGLIVLGLDGRILSANASVQRILGRTEEEMRGESARAVADRGADGGSRGDAHSDRRRSSQGARPDQLTRTVTNMTMVSAANPRTTRASSRQLQGQDIGDN